MFTQRKLKRLTEIFPDANDIQYRGLGRGFYISTKKKEVSFEQFKQLWNANLVIKGVLIEEDGSLHIDIRSKPFFGVLMFSIIALFIAFIAVLVNPL